MTKLTPAIKGLITGLIMVAIGVALYLSDTAPASPVQFISYFVYGLGIVWTVQAFARQSVGTPKFGSLFNAGFKCFIVVTLIMAVFTIVFYKLNQHIVEERAAFTKAELLKNEKNRTPAEIDQMVAQGVKYFIPMATSLSVFQYLIIGAVVTTATAGALSLRKK